MEWACGVIADEQGMAVKLQSASGERHQVPLTALAREGLPRSKGHARRTVVSQLSQWVLVDATPYLRFFGLAGSPGEHQVFAFHHGTLTVLVPALCLIRAIFRPVDLVLPEIFRPQGIDRVVLPSDAGTVSICTPRRLYAADQRCTLVDPMAWLYFDPAARRAADSVHACARHGTIGMVLPDVEVTARIYGPNVRRTVFATEIGLLSIKTPVGRNVLFSEHAPGTSGADKTPAPALPELRAHRDGSTWLTDDEWAALEPMIRQYVTVGRMTLDLRKVFDGIVNKFCLGTGWKTSEFREGSFANAWYLYRSLRRQGADVPLFNLLTKMRN